MTTVEAIRRHLAELGACRNCPGMAGPVVVPRPVAARVYLVGQAPGPREGALGQPFAWTAGRTLFRWFAGIGVDEETFRSRAYIAAVCRCFPGKVATRDGRAGGDRVPTPVEIAACAGWMRREIALLRPDLVIPVGRLAIERFLPGAALTAVIGRQHRVDAFGRAVDLLPLPHPSGASSWYKTEPGAGLTAQALALLALHPAWRALSAAAKSANR